MSALDDLRKKYPQYNDLSDEELADKYHSKYYSDIPKEQYYAKIGLSNNALNSQKPEQSSFLEDASTKIAQTIPELALGVMQLPGEAYGAITHPLNTLKNIPIGIAEGIANTFNIPGNITKYAAQKGYLPKTFGEYAPHIPIEKIEEKLGLLPSQSGEGLTRMLSGFGTFGKLGKFSEASNLGKAGLGAAYATGSGENPIVGAIAGSIPGLIKKGQQIHQYFKEPRKALLDAGDSINNIKQLIGEHQEQGRQEKSNISRFLNQTQEGMTSRQNNFESNLPNIFPIKPKSVTRSNLSNATNDSIQDLTNDFENRYNDFSNEFGHLEVNEPFTTNETNLKRLRHVSATTKNMAYNVSHDNVEYTDSSGDTRNIHFPADDSSVDDYVNFSRQLRDAAWDASRAAKDAAHGDKLQLRQTSTRLRQLQGEAEAKIRDTIGEGPYNKYRGIQKDYSQLMGPVKTEPSLFNAAYKKKISDKLHDTLLQPTNEHIRQYLYQRPEFVESLREHLMQGTKHPLTQGPQLNPAAIDHDINHLLTPEQHSALEESRYLSRAQNHLNNISKNIKKPDQLTTQQEQNIRQFHPDMNEYLNNLMGREQSINNLENQKNLLEKKQTGLKREKNKRYAIGVGLGALGSTLLPGNPIIKLIKKIL